MAEGTGVRVESWKEFQAWLDEKKAPKEICVALAARSALRALPKALAAWVGYDPNWERRFAELVAVVFRATALAWVAATYPTRANELASASAAAASADSWKGLSGDLTAIEAGATSRALASRPLWPEKAPAAAAIDWSRPELRALASKGFDVWKDWLAARERGDIWSEAREFIFATVPVEKWDEGPAAANAWIAEQLAKLDATEPAVASASAAPVAAVLEASEKIFDVRLDLRLDHGQLVPTWDPPDQDVREQYGGFSADELYADAREAFLDFAEHALDEAAGNYMPRDICRAARKLRESLPSALPETPPLSAERALAMALRAVDAAEKSGEISKQDMLFRHHLPELRGMYQRLAAIWPGLVDYREAAGLDRFVEPETRQLRAQNDILAAAAEAPVASPELKAQLSDTIAELAAAEKDIPPGASGKDRRRALYDTMKAAAAQITAVWRRVFGIVEKGGKLSGEADASLQNFEKLAQRLEKARDYWDWIEKWWL